MIRETMACSIVSSSSALFVVKLEFERNLAAPWGSVRCLAIGFTEATLLVRAVIYLISMSLSFICWLAYCFRLVQHAIIEVPEE